jgi:hypothetical protein
MKGNARALGEASRGVPKPRPNIESQHSAGLGLPPVTRATLSPPTTRAGGTYHEDCFLHPHHVFARPPPPPQWRALAEKLKRSAIVCSTVCRQCGLLSISACHFLPYPSEPVKNTENLATARVRVRVMLSVSACAAVAERAGAYRPLPHSPLRAHQPRRFGLRINLWLAGYPG